jgi:hypothetical protein
MNTDIVVALIGFVAGILVALVGGLTKLLEYRLEQRKLELEERQRITTVLGSSQSNFVRATRELYRRLSSFFDHPGDARQWLKPGPTAESDEYYLRDFVRLLFNFIAWGRIAQDTINSLPTTVTQERTDLQQTFLCVDLALDVLAYNKLFQGIDADNTENKGMHLPMADIDAVANAGSQLWKEGEQNISRTAFHELYHLPESPLAALRHFFVVLHSDKARSASFVAARLAALRTVLAGFLMSYSWTIYIPDERTLVGELQEDLQYASETSRVDLPFARVVPQNLGELMKLYQCQLFELP